MQDREAWKASHSEKVIIRLQGESIRGHLEIPVWDNLEDLLRHAPVSPLEVFRLQRLDTGVMEDISATDTKAVFFVRSFEGDDRRTDLKFHTHAPIVHGIWLRVEFKDGEIIEGIVYNSMHYLIDPGFFLLPTDPGSNNKMVYVIKKGLKDCRVLGVRAI